MLLLLFFFLSFFGYGGYGGDDGGDGGCGGVGGSGEPVVAFVVDAPLIVVVVIRYYLPKINLFAIFL